jgi:hypothetical protein
LFTSEDASSSASNDCGACAQDDGGQHIGRQAFVIVAGHTIVLHSVSKNETCPA